MKRKQPETREEFNSELERRWLATARPPKTNAVVNTIIFVVVLAAVCVAAYVNRARIGALWHQMTGKAASPQVMPEKPESR
jgi:hypothetical protein